MWLLSGANRPAGPAVVLVVTLYGATNTPANEGRKTGWEV
jgi:hypothetical protein